jgi:hypothetical protein
MNQNYFGLFLCLALLCHLPIRGQGCSDAGACTAPGFAIQTDSAQHTRLMNEIRVGLSYGLADNDITVSGQYLEYSRQINRIANVSMRLSGLAQVGNGISTWGMSDLFVSSRIALRSDISVNAGIKVPLMLSDRTLDGLPLPMDYQSSLGTIDLLLGLNYQKHNWGILVAWQQPLTQNRNQFNPMQYSEDSPLSDFADTRSFTRQGDILLRLSREFRWEKWSISPGILPIYHMGNDRFEDDLGVEREIEGSQGLTLNAIAFLDYRFSGKSAIQWSLGVPLVVRDTRPDGLTRSFQTTVEYRIRF